MTRDSESNLSQVLRGATCLLLDFDGPVCDVFAGEPAEAHATGLLRLYQEACGVSFVPVGLDATDPLEIVRRAGTSRDPMAEALADALTQAELSAVKSATLTPGAVDVVRAWHQSGRPVCVVSNNSTDAVRSFLAHHEIEVLFSAVVGRPHDVERMKPDPSPLHRALGAAKSKASHAVMIGDSVSDIEAAQRAGTRSVGFANRPTKNDVLARAGADAVVSSMHELADELSRPPK